MSKLQWGLNGAAVITVPEKFNGCSNTTLSTTFNDEWFIFIDQNDEGTAEIDRISLTKAEAENLLKYLSTVIPTLK